MGPTNPTGAYAYETNLILKINVVFLNLQNLLIYKLIGFAICSIMLLYLHDLYSIFQITIHDIKLLIIKFLISLFEIQITSLKKHDTYILFNNSHVLFEYKIRDVERNVPCFYLDHQIDMLYNIYISIYDIQN